MIVKCDGKNVRITHIDKSGRRYLVDNLYFFEEEMIHDLTPTVQDQFEVDVDAPWQPVETYDKMKEAFVLLRGPSGYVSTPYYVEVGRFIQGYRDHFVTIDGNSCSERWGHEPTEWMPLP